MKGKVLYVKFAPDEMKKSGHTFFNILSFNVTNRGWAT